ncbi:hypothetical protein NVP1256O_14 [Vibrio phage 1.256.O._10N.286.45.F8]|nr:hypothetical protein NVP1256O_14 [Vibrio phage 1.256.O._10N.286.45.F8]
MKNADMPAMPVSNDELASALELGADGSKGLTKREMIAKDIDVGEFQFNSINNLSEFIGRSVDQSSMVDLIKATAECDAKLRVIYADALLKELEK